MRLLLGFIGLLSPFLLCGQTTLSEGDILVLMYNADASGDDFIFSWMPLAVLDEGTVVHFTDAGWRAASSSFVDSAGDSHMTYTVTEDISAGTIMNYNSAKANYLGSISFDPSGDQLLIYQGTQGEGSGVRFITAFSGNGDWSSSVVGSSDIANSNLPVGLTDGTTALSFSEIDNYKYSGETNGTAAVYWQDRIEVEADWLTSDVTAFQMNYTSFSVSGIPPASSIFNGSGNWLDAARWTNGIPGSVTDVEINGSCRVDTFSAIDDLTIGATGQLTIGSDYGLDVKGDAVNNGTVSSIILESTLSSQALFICSSTGVDATVKRIITGGLMGNGNNFWHYMMLPITGSPLVENYYNDMYVLRHTEASITSSNDGWSNLVAGDVLEPDRAYAIWAKDTVEILYTGELRVGDQLMSLTYEGYAAQGNSLRGFNLIGNPYSATIDWDQVVSSDRPNVDDAIYLWNPTTRRYDTYVNGISDGQSQYIAPMQGFFVFASASGASITFRDGHKYGEGSVFKSNPLVRLLQLEAKQGRYSDFTTIYQCDNATLGYDGQFDSYKILPAEGSIPQLYCVSSQQGLAVNGVGEFDATSEFDLMLTTYVDNEVELSIEKVDNIPADWPVIIENRDRGIKHNLRESSLKLSATKGMEIRLTLKFIKATSEAVPQSSNILIWCSDRILKGRSVSSLKEVLVYNHSGVLLAQLFLKTNQFEIPLKAFGNVIVRTIDCKNKITTQKIVVQ